MNPLDNYDINTNFWEVNKQFKLSFKDLYDKDKSKCKEVSSKVMWLVAFTCEESDNTYSDIPFAERPTFLAKELGVTRPSDIDDLINKYLAIRTSYIQRKLINWKKQIDERDEYLNNLKWNDDNAEMKDKLMANTDKLYKQYFTIEKELSKESNTRDLGGKEVSLSDKGEI